MSKPRKPTALLKLSGSWRAEARDRTEPKPDHVLPELPEWLDDEGKRAWMHLVPILSRMRVLTEADGYALAVLCNAWSRYRVASDQLARFGDVYSIKDAGGRLKSIRRSPYAALQMEHALVVRRLLAEFGLTPASRGRLIALPESKNGKTDFFTKSQGTAATG